MSIKTIVISASLAVAATATAGNDATKAGSEFGYFVGTWKCQEKWDKSDISPAYESTSTLVAADNTKGVWVVWSYVQDPSKAMPQPPSGNDMWGYDPDAKTFVREKADSFAPGHTTHLTSKGFVDGTIAWDAQIKTPKGTAAFKHTFKKIDDKTIEGKLFLDGKQFYTSTCKKS
jgi:hypothetical protein